MRTRQETARAVLVRWTAVIALIAMTLGPVSGFRPASAQGARSADLAGPIWSLIPANATLVTAINTDPDSAQWPIAADLLEAGGLKNLVFGAINEFLLSSELSTSNLDPAQSSILGGSIALAAWGDPSDPTNHAALYVAASDPEAAFQSLKAQFLTEAGLDVVEGEIPGGRSAISTEDSVSIMLINDVVVFTELDDAELVASLVTGSGPSLAAFQPFADVMAAQPDELIARAYFNGPAAGMNTADVLTSLFGVSVSQLAVLLSLAGPVATTYTSLGLTAATDGFHLRTAQLPAPLIGPELPGPGPAESLAESISNEADVYLEGTDLGATPIAAQVISSIAIALAGREGGTWAEYGQRPEDWAFDRFRELTGIDLRAELIDQLKGDYQAAFAPNSTLNPTFLDMVLQSEVEDPEVVRDLIEKLTVLIQLSLAGRPDFGEMTSINVGEDVLHTLAIAPSTGSPSIEITFGVIAGQLRITVGDGADRFLDPQPADALSADPQYRAAFAALPTERGSRVYVDLGELLPILGVTNLNPPDDWSGTESEDATIEGIKAVAGIYYRDNGLAIADFVLLIQGEPKP
jgi:hypothetical protein